MTPRSSALPLTSLVGQAIAEIASLARSEVRLAQAEIGEKLGALSGAVVLFGIGSVFSLSAAIVLMFGAVEWASRAGIPYRWGFVLVGIVGIAIGLISILKAVRRLRTATVLPERTIHQLKADLATVKEQAK